ncbi:MAG: serine/threonine protein kinase [Alphaproteobacteria bacterium]|nr:MAG: serine/threonine protein kinase [Alphaproteobacteria bacterium]
MTLTLPGTSVSILGRAALLRGRSGAGKSDLALRLVDGGAVLVGDEAVVAERVGEQVVVSPMPSIRGLMEVRGFGVVALPTVARQPLRLIVDLVTGAEPERLPEPEWESVLGVAVRRMVLNPMLASAAARVRMALAYGS